MRRLDWVLFLVFCAGGIYVSFAPVQFPVTHKNSAPPLPTQKVFDISTRGLSPNLTGHYEIRSPLAVGQRMDLTDSTIHFSETKAIIMPLQAKWHILTNQLLVAGYSVARDTKSTRTFADDLLRIDLNQGTVYSLKNGLSTLNQWLKMQAI